MSDTTNTATSGAGAPASAESQQQNVAAQTPPEQVETTPEQQEAEKAERERREGEDRKRNRTRDYIERLQRRVAELETQQRAPAPQTPPSRQNLAPDAGPKLEDFGYDLQAFQQARDAWVLDQATTRFQQESQQRAAQEQEQRTWADYSTRAAQYANEHDDFYEVVGSMPALPMPLQAAIAAHANGPAIAYHLGNNLSDLIAFASTPPQYAEYALQQIAARLGTAPPPQTTAQAPAPKPITNAPPPAPTVGGRAASGPKDPDRMTTDEWLAWRNDQLKKRG